MSVRNGFFLLLLLLCTSVWSAPARAENSVERFKRLQKQQGGWVLRRQKRTKAFLTWTGIAFLGLGVISSGGLVACMITDKNRPREATGCEGTSILYVLSAAGASVGFLVGSILLIVGVDKPPPSLTVANAMLWSGLGMFVSGIAFFFVGLNATDYNKIYDEFIIAGSVALALGGLTYFLAGALIGLKSPTKTARTTMPLEQKRTPLVLYTSP